MEFVQDSVCQFIYFTIAQCWANDWKTAITNLAKVGGWVDV